MALLLLTLIALAIGQSCTRDTYTSLPAHPAFPTQTFTTTDAASTFVKDHWSQMVTLPRPPNTVVTTQTNCPHTASGLVDWHSTSTWGGSVPANGTNVTLPANKAVLISSCSFPKTFVFGYITVPVGSSLIIGDAPVTLQARGMIVLGSFLVGSPTCRLRNQITITIHGKRPTVLPAPPSVKGIEVRGQIDLHGVEYFPTWTRLAKTAFPGNRTIFIQDCPNWKAGQTIVITTTELKDSRDFNRNEKAVISSVQKVTSVSARTCAVTVTTPLLYKHYGGFEYQAEVALLSRNILVQGDPFNSEPTDTSKIACNRNNGRSTYPCDNTYLTGWGVHIMVMGGSKAGRFSGVEVYRGGQTNQLARYPIHWHMCGNVSQPNIYYATDCSVHHSFFRCYTIHGTSGTSLSTGVKLTKNVGYDVVGHCYFCSEDGMEENHTISYNLGAHIHILGPIWQASETVANDLPRSFQHASGRQSFASQFTNWVNSGPDLVLADDIAASPFYFTNSYSEIYGNAASGGWAGFAFPNLDAPIGNSYRETWYVPRNKPLLLFKGNSAHSTGFWQNKASGVYFGGRLKLTATPTASTSGTQYTAGRESARDTCTNRFAGGALGPANCPGANQIWMRLEDTKVFLANSGIQSWGTREEFIRFEVHDVGLSTNVFGKVWIDQMLVNCRSAHIPTYLSGCNITGTTHSACNVRDTAYWAGTQGFRFYDVGQSHLISNSIFTNCRPLAGNCANYPDVGCKGTPPARTVKVWTYLTHSDQYTPGLMQQTINISYVNVDVNSVMASATSERYVTVSGKAANWIDNDGTIVPTLTKYKGGRVNIGSNWTNDWWKFSSNCTETMQNWVCPLRPGDGTASVIMRWNISGESTIGSSTCGNGATQTNTGVWPYGYMPCPQGGMITHFGRAEGTSSYNISLMARVAGPLIAASGGWFVRYFAGTPKTLQYTHMQIKHNDVMLLAIPYPSGTKFNIYAQAPTSCKPGTAPYKPTDSICRHNYRAVSSVAAVRSAWGDAYYYDSAKFLLYVRIVSLSTIAGGRFGTNATYPSLRVWTSTTTKDSFFTRPGAPLSILGSGSNAWSINIIASNCGGTGTNCAQPSGVSVPAALSPLPAPVIAPNGMREEEQKETEQNSNVGPIVGGVVGGVVGLVLIGLVVVFVVYRKPKTVRDF